MKKINVNNLTKLKLIEWCQEFAKPLGITIIYKEIKGKKCYANVSINEIYLNTNKFFTKALLAFVFFHELGHFQKGGDYPCMNDFANASKLRRTNYINKLLQIEKRCDNYGERESKKYFKNPNCFKPYHKSEGWKKLAIHIAEYYGFKEVENYLEKIYDFSKIKK